MTNKQVIINFLNGKAGHTPTRTIHGKDYNYEGQTLKSNGQELINYNTIIAYFEKEKLFINIKKYSQTTSTIQNILKEQVKNYISEENIIFYEGGAM